MKITKRKEGEWVIDFTLNRKRIRRIIKGSRKMAEQAAEIIKADIHREKYKIPGPKKRIKFEKFSEIYLKQHSKHKKAYKLDETQMKNLKKVFKDKFFDEITPGDIVSYREKRESKVSPATVNRELALLRSMFNRAIEWEDYGIERNPVKKVKFLSVKKSRERILSIAEMKRLIKTAKEGDSKYLYLFLVIGINTGMRKMEVLSLEWKDVDMKKRTIRVRREKSKSGKERIIPMNEVIAAELEKLKRKGLYVFYNPKTRTYIRNIKTTFWKTCKDAGISNFTVHDLRHTAASLLVNDCGIDLVTASKILGHSDIQMTVRYIHPSDYHKRLGIERLGEIFKTGRHKVDKSADFVEIRKPVSHSNYYN